VCSLPLLTVPSGTGVVLLPLHLAWSTTEVEEAYPPYQPVILRSEGALTYSCVAPPPVEPYLRSRLECHSLRSPLTLAGLVA
jgi:hypothetical protein